MKRLIITLAVLLLATGAGAEEPIRTAWMNPAVVGSGVAPASSCNPATNEVGNRTVGSTDDTDRAASTALGTGPSAADCSGNLKNGFIDMDGTSSAKAKVCVYAMNSQSSTALATDCTGTNLCPKLACTDYVVSSSNAYADAGAFSGTLGVVLGTKYWLVLFVASDTANAWRIAYDAGGNTAVATSCTEPDYLSTCTWTNVNNRLYGLYGTIQ